MRWIHPTYVLRFLDWLNCKVDYDRLLSTPDDHAGKRFGRASVDLLMRNVGWNVDEIAWPGLCGKLQTFAPAHAGVPADHVDHAFQFPVVMRTRYCLGVGILYRVPKGHVLQTSPPRKDFPRGTSG